MAAPRNIVKFMVRSGHCTQEEALAIFPWILSQLQGDSVTPKIPADINKLWRESDKTWVIGRNQRKAKYTLIKLCFKQAQRAESLMAQHSINAEQLRAGYKAYRKELDDQRREIISQKIAERKREEASKQDDEDKQKPPEESEKNDISGK